ncbi:multidrug resistance, partial [Fusarium albosuccineum]
MPSLPSSSASSTTVAETGPEIQPIADLKPSQWAGAFIPVRIDKEKIADYNYAGEGTSAAPFLVEFLPNDPQDAMTFSVWRKWIITIVQAIATLAVTFASSAYSGGIREIMGAFNASQEVATLGVSLYVLGFAVGPLLWAPLSELYGRQTIFLVSYTALVAFNVGAACAQTLTALLVLRFFAGAFGSSPLTNAGGVIADMFNGSERGLATSLYAMAPFLGPAIGPIVGGFLGQTEGWRWLHGVMVIFTGVLLIMGALLVPETYAPFLLRRRAKILSKATGKVYISILEAGEAPKSLVHQLKVALTRPWVLLFKEPIVFLTSIYISIIYGTLYLCSAAFPIVFQAGRGWSLGLGGLAFIGIAVGVTLATLGSVLDNRHYSRLVASKGDLVEPEDRLPPAIVGSVLLPIGLFWFAWTTDPSVHWAVPIVGTVFFAIGLVLVFMSLLNYLIDA